jgi:hypothetical protein
VVSIQDQDAVVVGFISACLISLGRYEEAKTRAMEAIVTPGDRQGSAQPAHALQHLAAVAALHPQGSSEHQAEARVRAARLIGFVDARLVALGSPQYFQVEHD